MPNDLVNKVRKWIDESGYGLEMRAASLFRQAGLPTIQGEFYLDPESGVPRETDIHVYEPHGITYDQASVSVVAECKRTSKPWVLFSTQRQFDSTASVEQRLTTPSGARVLKALASQAAVQQLSLFQLPTHLGYSLVAASLDKADKDRDGGGDRAYSGLLSVTTAAGAILEKNRGFAAMAWPLLVLEGQLLQAVLNQQGDIDVTQIDRGILAWRNPRLGHHVFVMIVTEAGLSQLVPDLARDMRTFVSLATIEVEKLRVVRG